MDAAEIDASFGAWVSRRRRILSLTQADLADQTHCSLALIRKIERDERRPSRELALLLATALKIPSEEQAHFVQVARGEKQTLTLLAAEESSALRTAEPAFLPPAAALDDDAPGLHLPVPTTPLIGRATEVTKLRHLLAQPQCRLLTIAGAGGIGKTRLALALASLLSEPGAAAQEPLFPHGVYFVALASVTSAAALMPTIAGQVGLTFARKSNLWEQVARQLRGRRLLLVLDNVEQLLDRESAPLGGATSSSEIENLSRLLAEAPGVKILVTSRERLNLAGEWVFDLQGLPVPSTSALATQGNGEYQVEASAIALFVSCAQRLQQDFALSASNRADIVQICRSLEGMPLAIELAAAWVPLLSCKEIATEIQRTFDFLGGVERRVEERHRSMRAVLDGSWRRLHPEEQAVLARLSILRGEFTREAAEAVALASLWHLSSLMAKSLLRRSAATSAPNHHANRFDLHELVRQYASLQLSSSAEEKATRARHLSYYVARIKATAVEVAAIPLAQESLETLVARLRPDYGNFEAALLWALEQGLGDEAAFLAGALWRFWYEGSYFRQGRQWLEMVVTLWGGVEAIHAFAEQLETADAAKMALRAALASVLSGAGIMAWVQGDHGSAEARLMTGSLLQRRAGNLHDLAISLYYLGNVAVQRANEGAGRLYLEECLALRRTLGDSLGVAQSLNGLGWVALERDELAQARALFAESLQLYQRLGDRANCAAVLDSLGWAVMYQDEAESALGFFRQSLALAAKLGDKRTLIACFDGMAAVTLLQDLMRAAQLTQASELLRAEIGAPLNPKGTSRYERTANDVRRQLATSLLAHTELTIDELPRYIALWIEE